MRGVCKIGAWAAMILLMSISCDDSSVVASKSGYELVHSRGNLTQHQGGNLELWHASASGKILVWRYVVRTEVLDGMAVFSGGLTDDRQWKVYPAVLAFKPGVRGLIRGHISTYHIGIDR
jgi:hypothetical protein